MDITQPSSATILPFFNIERCIRSGRGALGSEGSQEEAIHMHQNDNVAGGCVTSLSTVNVTMLLGLYISKIFFFSETS